MSAELQRNSRADSPIIHPLADVQSKDIGAGTLISQFATVMAGARIGRECNILSYSSVRDGAIVGDRVTISSGVQLLDGVRLQDDVFIGPNVAFSDDRFSRSAGVSTESPKIVVEKGASICAGAVLSPGVTIGRNATVEAGTVITRSVPPNAIVVGNPAKIIGYVEALQNEAAPSDANPDKVGAHATSVSGVTLHVMPRISDLRGSLTVGEFERGIPFSGKRYFMTFDVPSMETRGEHAHKKCHQFLTCVRGRCAVVADDGAHRQEFLLDSPVLGLHIPPLVWGIQYKFSTDGVLLVFASEYYDPADYIRDYGEFCRVVGAAG
jgi:acetyltransferase-like isoleucine patch superfamily enzyme/dTDP-4-dehydrorhamnose 3,5-epimerase-like enzyme